MAVLRSPSFRSRRSTDEAAAWAARRLSGEIRPADEAAFHAWLTKRPQNRESYRRAAEVVARFDALAGDVQARELLRSKPRRDARAPVAGWGSGLRSAAALAASIAALFVASLYVFPDLLPSRPLVVETGRGGQEQIRTQDGSVVTLGPLTRVTVTFGRRERVVSLERGQADFEVAKDPKRPFRVVAGGHEVRALGTVFDMRRKGEGLRVSLVEGRLALTNSASGPAATAYLSAGQAADFTASGEIRIGPANLIRDRAWRTGRIVFEGDRLAEAVAEVNRYNGLQIVLSDRRVADYRVSGVFDAREPLAFAAALTATFPLTAVNAGGKTVLLAPADQVVAPRRQ